MTERDKFMYQPVDPVKEAQWRLMRRDDLASVLGFVFRVPFHGQDESGRWRYGLPPKYGEKNAEVSAEFEAEMRRIIIDSASPLVDAGILSEEQVEAIRSHPYETGPAAGDWWQYFIEIYQQADPLISRAADLIAVADVVRRVAAESRDWRQRKRDEIERDRGATVDPSGPFDPDPQLVLTMPGLVSLCFDDLVHRHGKTGDVSIVVFPRNRWEGYGSVDHPGLGETYVIRLTTTDSEYFYLVDGAGGVSEHYRTEGDDIILLAIPDLLPNDTSGNPYRQPETPRRFEVRASPSSKS